MTESTAWEYRAVLKESDTGEAYDVTGVYEDPAVALTEAEVLMQISNDGTLPPLVVDIERRERASAWESLP